MTARSKALAAVIALVVVAAGAAWVLLQRDSGGTGSDVSTSSASQPVGHSAKNSFAAACGELAKVPAAGFDMSAGPGRVHYDRIALVGGLATLAGHQDGAYADKATALRRPYDVATHDFSAQGSNFVDALKKAREACPAGTLTTTSSAPTAKEAARADARAGCAFIRQVPARSTAPSRQEVTIDTDKLGVAQGYGGLAKAQDSTWTELATALQKPQTVLATVYTLDHAEVRTALADATKVCAAKGL